MTTRRELIAEARTWIGTPYRHQGRLKGIATDCVGFAICIAKARGLFPGDFDVTGYGVKPDPKMMGRFLDLHMDRIAVSAATGGDILWVRPRRAVVPHHLQLLTFDRTVIHAIDRQRGVREHIYDPVGYPVAAAFSYRGIES